MPRIKKKRLCALRRANFDVRAEEGRGIWRMSLGRAESAVTADGGFTFETTQVQRRCVRGWLRGTPPRPSGWPPRPWRGSTGARPWGSPCWAYVARSAAKVTPYTLRGYRELASSLSCFDDALIDLLDAAQVQAYFDGLIADGLSRSMVAKKRNLAAAAVRDSVAGGRATRNPFADVSIPRRPPSRRKCLDEVERARLEYLLSAASGKAAVGAGLAFGCGLASARSAR